MKSCDCELLIDYALFIGWLYPAIVGIIWGIIMDDNLWVLIAVILVMSAVMALINRNLLDAIKRQHDLKKAKREAEGCKLLSVVTSVLSSSLAVMAKDFAKESSYAELVAACGVALFVWVNVHYYRKLLEFIDEETGE